MQSSVLLKMSVLSEVGVEEWLDAQVITRAKKTLPGAVPDGEGEVSEQVFDTILAPDLLGAQDQLDIGGIRGEAFVTVGLELGGKFAGGRPPGLRRRSRPGRRG